MLSKEQKIEKLKKIAQMADKINSVGNVFIAKKFDDIEENISSLDNTLAGYISSDGSTGATGTFTTADLKTVTVKDGIITSIV